jgi:6,7-dimethyl-8-ribityllumazine synthase
MATKKKNLSEVQLPSLPDLSSKAIGIVTAEWNGKITLSMERACKDTLMEHGILEENIHQISVPGAFELPMGARLLAGKEKLDAIICIGCVIKGETKHDEYISHAVATGIMNLGLASGKPVIFGVLTPNSMEQALDRSGGKHGNKGVEAATTALRMLAVAHEAKLSKTTIGFGA